GRRHAQQGCRQDGQDGADVGGELEADELDDVVVDDPAFPHGTDDGGEVVVGQDQGGRLLGHRGAGNAHGDSDVGGLEGGGIVDSVAGHGGNMTTRLQGLHDLDLVFRCDAGEDRNLVDLPGQLVGAHPVE